MSCNCRKAEGSIVGILGTEPSDPSLAFPFVLRLCDTPFRSCGDKDPTIVSTRSFSMPCKKRWVTNSTFLRLPQTTRWLVVRAFPAISPHPFCLSPFLLPLCLPQFVLSCSSAALGWSLFFLGRKRRIKRGEKTIEDARKGWYA